MKPKTEYQKKLLDPRWQKKRLEIMSHDRFSCRMCGDNESTLHVHHVHYDSRAEGPWDYPNTSLVTLCHECHSLEGEDLQNIRLNLMQSIVAAGFWRSGQLEYLDAAFSTRASLSPDKVDELCSIISSFIEKESKNG